MKKELSKATWWLWREWLKPFAIVIAIIAPLRSSIADWNDVPTGSMKPTILEGDRVFVNKLAYELKVPFSKWTVARWDNPQRGEIVVFYSPHDGTRLVKRVVGVPGDRLQLSGNVLYLNGQRITYQPASAEYAQVIPPDERRNSTFLIEELPGRDHPVMLMAGSPSMRFFREVTVPADHYFMMGDNRDNSADSRYFGFVPRSHIVGEATAVAISLDREHYYFPRWERFLKPLQ